MARQTAEQASVCQTCGAILLESGDLESAESVYRADLKKFPDNGWFLYGLAQSLRAQGKNDEAAAVDEQFETGWTHADVEIDGSRF